MTPTKSEHWGRKVTPITSSLTAIMSVCGFPALIWFGLHFIDGLEKKIDSIDTKSQARTALIFQKITDFSGQEQKDYRDSIDKWVEVRTRCCSELR